MTTNIERKWAGKTYLTPEGNHTVGQYGWRIEPYDNDGLKHGTLIVLEKNLLVRERGKKEWKKVPWKRVFEKLLMVILIAVTIGTASTA